MPQLSQALARLLETLRLPEDASLTVDIDPVNLI
jgi:hypothetical protein